MSVFVTFRAVGDPVELERRAAADPQALRKLLDAAAAHGVIHHRFLGTEDGDIMVLDEWETAEGFKAFLAENPQIQATMREVGVSAEPEIKFWRPLATNDEL